jgi:hypothetical protein
MSQHQIEILLPHTLKELNLPLMVKNYPSHARQAREGGLSSELLTWVFSSKEGNCKNKRQLWSNF